MNLAMALKDMDMTQAELAKRLGVTAPAVNQWVRGIHTIPDVRREQIEIELGVTLTKTEFEYTGNILDRDEYRTPLSYVVWWSQNVGHHTSLAYELRSPEWLEQRVSATARHLKATKAQLEQAIIGQGLLTFDDVQRVSEMFRFNGEQLEQHVGNLWPEDMAALETVQLLEATEALTFRLLRERVAAAEMVWRNAELMPGILISQDFGNRYAVQDISWWLEGGWPDIGNVGAEQNLEGRYAR